MHQSAIRQMTLIMITVTMFKKTIRHERTISRCKQEKIQMLGVTVHVNHVLRQRLQIHKYLFAEMASQIFDCLRPPCKHHGQS